MHVAWVMIASTLIKKFVGPGLRNSQVLFTADALIALHEMCLVQGNKLADSSWQHHWTAVLPWACH